MSWCCASDRPLAEQRAAIEHLVAATRDGIPGEAASTRRSPRPTGASAIGPSGRVGFVGIPFDDQIAAEDGVPLAQSVAAANAGPLDVIVAGGPAVQREMNPALRRDLVRAELVAGALSLVVLVLVLGSLAAGIVPLVLALFVIPIVLSIVFALSHLTDVTVFAPNVVTLVGLGIAIDYSLLVVYRFREELGARPRRAGRRRRGRCGRPCARSCSPASPSRSGSACCCSCGCRSCSRSASRGS